MSINRRQLLKSLAATAAGTTLFPAFAQPAFPSRPITIVVSTTTGGLPDHAARLYGERMSAFLKQPVLVENMAGAGGLLAARRIATAPPDGYLLLSVANTVVAQPLINSKAGYTMKSLTPVGELGRTSLMVATAASSPFRTLGELIAAAKAQPAQLSYGSSGNGTTTHLAVEMLASKAGVKFMHVPYKGITAAFPDLVAGRLAFLMAGTTALQELTRSGTLRALAITSNRRSPVYPDVPTMSEQGYPDAAFDICVGAFAPANLPPAVKARLAEAMDFARNDPKLVQALLAAGTEISAARTPDLFSAVVAADDEKLRKVIKDAHIATD